MEHLQETGSRQSSSPVQLLLARKRTWHEQRWLSAAQYFGHGRITGHRDNAASAPEQLVHIRPELVDARVESDRAVA